MDRSIVCMDATNNRLQELEQRRRSGTAGVQMNEETSWQRDNALTDEVVQETSSTGTHTLYPRPVEEQDHVSACRQGPFDHEKGPNTVCEYIQGGVVPATNTFPVKLQVPMTLPTIRNTTHGARRALMG